MATRSAIALRQKNGTIRVIYCHWDGYLSHNGRILLEHYNTEKQVNALLRLGDLSSLKPSPKKPPGHSYTSPVDGYCVAYGRDRGLEDMQARTYDCFAEAFGPEADEFVYVFDNGWMVAQGTHIGNGFYLGDLQPLTEELIRQEEEEAA